MRVITPVGVGDAEATNPAVAGTVKVFLDREVRGRRTHELRRREQVFPFSNWGVVRVVDLGDGRIISNLQFRRSFPAACEIARQSCPVDETRIAFDLERMAFQSNLLQRNGLGRFVTLSTRVDTWTPQSRWTVESSFATVRSWLQSGMDEANVPENGIGALLALDLEQQRLLGVALIAAPPAGVMFNKGSRM